MPREDLIRYRRGTAAEWTATDPVLELGEVGFETDTRLQKVGDGATSWTQLDYVAVDLTFGTGVSDQVVILDPHMTPDGATYVPAYAPTLSGAGAGEASVLDASGEQVVLEVLPGLYSAVVMFNVQVGPEHGGMFPQLRVTVSDSQENIIGDVEAQAGGAVIAERQFLLSVGPGDTVTLEAYADLGLFGPPSTVEATLRLTPMVR